MVTSLGRSVQIGSNSVCTQKGPVPIDLFCLLIFTLSIYMSNSLVQSACTVSRSICTSELDI